MQQYKLAIAEAQTCIASIGRDHETFNEFSKRLKSILSGKEVSGEDRHGLMRDLTETLAQKLWAARFGMPAREILTTGKALYRQSQKVHEAVQLAMKQATKVSIDSVIGTLVKSWIDSEFVGSPQQIVKDWRGHLKDISMTKSTQAE